MSAGMLSYTLANGQELNAFLKEIDEKLAEIDA
jgi:hypothetical protein